MSAVATAVRGVTARANRRTRAGAAILAALVLIAIFAPVLAPHDPNAIDPTRILAPPDLSHPFGSDALGRDVLSRVLFAFRVSLAVAVGSVLLALVVGIPLGLIAGYVGGAIDSLLMRPVDLLLALPALLLALSLISVTGPGMWVALFAIAVIYVPILARVVRSSTLQVANEDYVAGAGARGVSRTGVMLRHVMPNSLGPAVVQASVLMGFAIQIEAALSFLGLGAQPPTPSLGLMLADGYQVLQQAPWADIFPGLAIAITVLAFLLIGDGIREHFDPRGVSR